MGDPFEVHRSGSAMGLTRLAITRPLAVLMVIVGFVLLGSVSFTRMQVDRFPALSFPAVLISTTYPGAPPIDVEELLARPIERAVSVESGVESITSTSSEGFLSIAVRFVEGTDPNQAVVNVERAIGNIRGDLPDGAAAPSALKAEFAALPIMNVAMYGNRSLMELFDLGNDVVLPRLRSVDGVADVTMVGGLQREIQVKVAPQRLRAYGIPLHRVEDALRRENVSSPSGRLDAQDTSLSVRALAPFQTLEDIQAVVLQTTPTFVRLRDVATVVDTYREPSRIQRYNGRDAIGFIITKAVDANGVQVADKVRDTLTALQQSSSSDVQMTITSDASTFTRRSVHAVINDLHIGVILTGVVLLLFLHTWRNTLIVMLAIPSSLISTFLVMYFFGFSLNVISLMALALTIGILVDDSIVVLENMTRHLELGEAPREAALRGRSEIGLAAIAITLVDVIVFLPVSFMSGNVGRVFMEFGITIAAATLFSLLVSFTLTPLLAARWSTSGGGGKTGALARFGMVWDTCFDRLARRYRLCLRGALNARWAVVVTGLAALTASILMLALNIIGSEFVPVEDDGLFTATLTMPPGTSLQGTDAVVRRAETLLSGIPEVEGVFSSVGVGGGVGGLTESPYAATIGVRLVDKHDRAHSVFDIMEDARRAFHQVPQAQVRVAVTNLFSAGPGALIVRVQGKDIDKLTTIAQQVEEIVRMTPGATDVQNNAEQRDPEIRIDLDRERLADANVSASTVASAMQAAVGGTVVGQLRPGENQVDIRLIAADAARSSPDQLGAIPLMGEGGTLIRVDQVATLVRGAGPARILRVDRQRAIEVTANVAGRSLGDVTRDVRAATSQIPLPEGCQIAFAGQVQQQESAFSSLLQALALSVILIYMLMVALYESWLAPLAIMFSLPVSLVGAFFGLLVTGNTFNIYSLIGMIMLMGLVGKNAILLVDFIATLRARGVPRLEAICESGYTRLRPIVMTTATVVLAMLPLASKLEQGGEARAPMAVVIIGGVLSSTLLTLFLVPVMYSILDDGSTWLLARWPSRSRGSPAQDMTQAPAAAIVIAPDRVSGSPPASIERLVDDVVPKETSNHNGLHETSGTTRGSPSDSHRPSSSHADPSPRPSLCTALKPSYWLRKASMLPPVRGASAMPAEIFPRPGDDLCPHGFAGFGDQCAICYQCPIHLPMAGTLAGVCPPRGCPRKPVRT